MKKRFTLPLLLLSAALPIAAGSLSYRPVLETYAATSVSNYSIAALPSTIDLNPVAEADIRSYYAALDDKNYQGNDLLKALKPILKNGQNYYSYDQGSGKSNNVWKAYEITDRDWTLSPASSITNGTYDPSTNIISNYKFAKSGGDNPYNHLLYRNPGVEEGHQRAWDKHGNNDGTDREHIWPKSRGFGKDTDQEEHKFAGARGDLHHLLPGDSYVNSALHSNNPYGFVDPAHRSKDAGNEYKINDVIVVANNYLGAPATPGISNPTNIEVFEPQDCDKGDIARACFYMVARYNNLSGDDATIDAGNPNLYLDDTLSVATEMSYADHPVSIGILRDLLAWHKLDPVDEYEIHRNDIIYRNFDHNRNPFIDFPSWVDAIWGTSVYDEENHCVSSYSNEPVGVASPKADALYHAGQGGGGTPSSSESSSASSSSESSSVPSSSESSSASSSSESSSVPSSQPTSAPSSSPASAPSSSEGSGGTPAPSKDAPQIPTWVFIVGGIALALIVIVVVIVAVKGKGKSKKVAKKILKSGAKNLTSSGKGKSSANGNKKKK